MESPMTPSHMILSNLERSNSRSLRFWSLISCKRARPYVPTKDVCRKMPFVTPIAGVKQSAKVHGPLAEISHSFSSAWLCQQNSWNRNLSVARASSVRTSVSQLSVNLNARISFKFWSLLPWAIHSDVFWIFFVIFFFFQSFTNIFRFHYHGTLWERKFQNATALTNRLKFSNFSWLFFLLILKNYVWDFWNFENAILTNYIRFR